MRRQDLRKIIWLKEPNYIHKDDGPVGKQKTDRKNPDPSLRTKPLLGLQIMRGLTPKGNNKWVNGACYNPETGKTYKFKMQLTAPDRLINARLHRCFPVRAHHGHDPLAAH